MLSHHSVQALGKKSGDSDLATIQYLQRLLTQADSIGVITLLKISR